MTPLDRLLQSSTAAIPLPLNPHIQAALPTITEEGLRETVRALSYPRHFHVQPDANRQAGDYITGRFQAAGFATAFQGEYRNVLAWIPGPTDRPVTVLGAHYDSVPETPGADDNGSAVAGLIACAEAVARHAPESPLLFVAFNREEMGANGEDGLVGSRDFALGFLPGSPFTVRGAHILEMIGYRDGAAGAQRTPPGLPVTLPDTGDWLGLVGNAASAALVATVLSTARTYTADLLTLGLTIPPGAEPMFPVLSRSDHAPFWEVGIPALQWTDTAEFRNPHYHQPTDTPETLDYEFLAAVTRLALACLLA